MAESRSGSKAVDAKAVRNAKKAERARKKASTDPADMGREHQRLLADLQLTASPR